ncbi:Uncharacterized protein HZ326_18048 [Fusarium oxysporum f. sp. albedinis]|nr:Uncharacterized protein HZ326_18048 [Fusarium oxysporum f. sp. albedinis]
MIRNWSMNALGPRDVSQKYASIGERGMKVQSKHVSPSAYLQDDEYARIGAWSGKASKFVVEDHYCIVCVHPRG